MSGAYLLDGLLRTAAERAPDKRAVESERATLSYGALDTAADRVAAALAEQGVGLGDRVGVQLAKGIEAVVALYGVMRAGAAYVPLDVAMPPARSAQIATDAGIAALIAEGAGIDALRAVDPAAAPSGIVCAPTAPAGFRTWDEVQSAGSPAPLSRPVVDTDIAYILYTSGSTGRPKGVVISHRNALSFVRWARRSFDVSEADVFSSHAPFHFDLSIFDLYVAAATGATVALVPPAAAMFPVRLADWIRERRISVWYSVPSALSMLVRYGAIDSRPLDSLRLILFAGEVFPVRYLRELMSLVPHARFFNLYGPTETNVCTYYEVDRPPAADDPPVPIGRACENMRCAVLDHDGEPVTAVGSEGELVVTGSSVAQGYWGDPETSARVFPTPYMCRTGDVVELLDDGPRALYRFVGRRDHLVKSRGYRIELGEIEAALYAHAAVEECVVVAVPDELMGSRIVAFCTVTDDASEDELGRACRDRLPPYMIPQPIAIVDALPRTPNDKYDRVLLSARAATMTGS